MKLRKVLDTISNEGSANVDHMIASQPPTGHLYAVVTEGAMWTAGRALSPMFLLGYES